MKIFGIAAALLLGAMVSTQAQQSFNYINREILGVGGGTPSIEGQPVNTATTDLNVRAPLPGLFYPNGAQAYGTEFVRLSDVLAAADAVSLGGAGYNGTGADLIAVSARIREDVIV